MTQQSELKPAPRVIQEPEPSDVPARASGFAGARRAGKVQSVVRRQLLRLHLVVSKPTPQRYIRRRLAPTGSQSPHHRFYVCKPAPVDDAIALEMSRRSEYRRGMPVE